MARTKRQVSHGFPVDAPMLYGSQSSHHSSGWMFGPHTVQQVTDRLQSRLLHEQANGS